VIRSIGRSVVAAVALVFMATALPTAANVNAGIPADIRSGERVHWTPEDIASLVRVLRAEGTSRVQAAELAQIVHSESRALWLDPLYALALIKIESNFRANAVSSQGAVGLLQLRPAAARSVAVVGGESVTGEAVHHPSRLRDPQTNVSLGLRYLRHLEGQFADRTTALAAYNLGPTRVRRTLEKGAPVPRAYADRVLAAYRALAQRESASAVRPPAPRS
jgi:soluble lytic murein transglycosylase-like protein